MFRIGEAAYRRSAALWRCGARAGVANKGRRWPQARRERTCVPFGGIFPVATGRSEYWKDGACEGKLTHGSLGDEGVEATRGKSHRASWHAPSSSTSYLSSYTRPLGPLALPHAVLMKHALDLLARVFLHMPANARHRTGRSPAGRRHGASQTRKARAESRRDPLWVNVSLRLTGAVTSHRVRLERVCHTKRNMEDCMSANIIPLRRAAKATKSLI